MSLLEVDKISIEVLKEFRKTKMSKAISVQTQKYILELDRAAEILNIEGFGNISKAAKHLQLSFPEMAHNTARKRLYDSINYFHLNSTVKHEAWNNYFADRMEDLAVKAEEEKNITESRRCLEKARQYRLDASNNSINPDDFKPVTQLISPNVDAKRLGFAEEFNLRKLWTDTEKFINDLPVDDRDKQRALDDASQALGIEDIDYEDL